ncbi:MAG: hypothetical protein L7S72_07800 [Flavobacteriales bacterium]|nr:hypothetical protein [Flavobacteriales bacterium]
MNKQAQIKINIDIPLSIAHSLSEYLSSMENLVLVCRTKKEPHYGKDYPSEDIIKIIKKNIKSDFKVFYQNPWPSHVPNFSNKKNIIRFGYDEGCELDKLIFNKKLKCNQINTEYYYLLNKNKITEIKSKNSLL